MSTISLRDRLIRDLLHGAMMSDETDDALRHAKRVLSYLQDAAGSAQTAKAHSLSSGNQSYVQSKIRDVESGLEDALSEINRVIRILRSIDD